MSNFRHIKMPELSTDEIKTKPDLIGEHGRAWNFAIPKVDNPHATIANWIIEAPWAHPLWHSYAIFLIHLRPVEGIGEPLIMKQDATHEMHLVALDPSVSRQEILDDPMLFRKAALRPLNYIGQFIEVTDELAIERIKATVQEVVNGKLNPDTDFMHQWIERYGNDMIKDEFK